MPKTPLQTTRSPIDGSVYVKRPLASDAEVDATLARARAAQAHFAHTTVAERAELCTRLVDAFVAEAPAIAEEITRQMGRPIAYTPGEVRGFEERSRHMIGAARRALADVEPEAKPGFSRFIRHEPLGLVFTIAPWNYPYLTSVNSIIPALMAGNVVLLKHSSQTPLCAERCAEAAARAGLPDGVFQILHMSHDQVERAIGDPRVDFVAFTGSVSGGHAIVDAARGRFIQSGLELGGKDPAYVRADADLGPAVESLVDGAFFNSGQSCCGIERIYVHESLYSDFVEGAVELTRRYVLGNPLDPATTLGPMVRTSAADFVRGQIDAALRQGARALIDESGFSASRRGSPYLAPQILVDVDHSMDVMKEESFGPVVGIMSVPDDETALKWMNDSAYGLTASIFTQDVEIATKLGGQLETGTVFMNRCDYLDPALAWTGVKDSGRGCTLSELGFLSLTRPKSYHFRL
jgi:acyl-CoA reductase-like NAD-dependent aldehyde dehydrogenase